LSAAALIFMVASTSADLADEEERPVELTTAVRLRKRGRDMAR
jgi:hypothetical protein